MSPAKLILITTLLVNYSSASDIINPYTDTDQPTVLDTQMDYTQDEETVEVESVQMDYTQEEEVVSTIDDNSNFSDVQNSYSDTSEIVRDEPLYITTFDSESINNEPSSITTVESNPTPLDSGFIDNEPHFQEPKNKEYIELKQKGLNLVNSDNQDYDPIAPNIQGEYSFIQGTDLNVRKVIQEGYLVIEKLNDNNFGYYYTFKVEKATPKTFFGIFHYYKGKFYQRAIKNEGSFETEDLKNTDIKTDGNKLELEISIEGGTLNILWENDNGGAVPFGIQKSLKEAKHDYEEIYKKNFSKLR